MYILKNKNDDLSYTSGYAVSENKDRIMFFYSNMPLSVRFYKLHFYKPSIDNYKYDVQLLSVTHRIKHFPKEIPTNARNYEFVIENSFDGYNINSLRFNTDREYIEKIKRENKTKIYKKVDFKEAEKYYRRINAHFELEDKEKYTLYVLKNENNDYAYTSGIIISEEKEDIIFFYANYCLDNTRTVQG